MTHSGPVCISVGGGKGGVGKSVVAANLGVAIADLGFRTVIIDADLGAANQHTLFGIDRPGQSLQAFLDKDVRSLEEIASPTGAPRLFLVPGIGAVPGAANLNHAQIIPCANTGRGAGQKIHVGTRAKPPARPGKQETTHRGIRFRRKNRVA